MPQGGIDEGEEPQAAALRELGEETGIAERHIQFLARAKEEHYYDLPDELVGKIWNGQYRGQRQVWFLARFTGTDDDVNIETDHQEFRAWKWADPDILPELIVPFTRKLYRAVLQRSEEHTSALQSLMSLSYTDVCLNNNTRTTLTWPIRRP